MTKISNFYVFEGPDNVGKTILSHALVSYLRTRSVICEYWSFPGCESNTLGNFIYNLHHYAITDGVRIDPTSLQLLHIAAHIDLIEHKIRPAFEAGSSIILDRFWLSTLIYGAVYGANAQSLDTMVAIERGHWRDLLPTAMFIVERKVPFGEEVTPTWNDIARKYDEVSSRDLGFPVHHIRNEGALQEAMEQVLSYL